MSHHELTINLSNADFNLLLQEEGSGSDDIIPSPYDLNNFDCSYWNTDCLAKHIFSNKTDFLLHLNIQCLSSKFDNFITFLNLLSLNTYDNLPVILALSETWLSDSNENAFPISGYHPIVSKIRKDNSGRGGVALYVRDDIDFIPRPDLDIFIPFTFESVFIMLKDLNITIGVIYRSPAADIASFLQTYQHLFYTLSQSKEKVFLLGDFNIDLLDYHSNTNVSEFVDLAFEFGFIPTITKPTRITPTSASCIDNIITDTSLRDSFSGVLIEDISDHYPVFCQISICPTLKQRGIKESSSVFRDYCDANTSNLNNKLSAYDWHEITIDSDPSSAANKLNAILTSLLDQTCPLKSNTI